MAQYNDEIILNITTNYATAVNEIVKLTNELGKLKADMEGVRQAQKDGLISSDEANKRLEALNAEYRRLNASVKSYRSEIDANLKAEEANAGSLKEMRAQLKNLLKEYDELSQVDREAIGGVGEEKLLEIRRLQEELRNAEEASGRFQRSVGSYEDAIKRAFSGTVPLKTALKDLKTEIQQLSIQYKSMNGEIDAQRAKLQELGSTVGTDSQEYKEQAQLLSDLEQKYTETGDAINKMSLAAGEISDTIGDTNASIANFGKDNANMKAVAEGMGVLANSYQVAKAGMAAFGMESEAMIEIWAKMQVIQQGVAALNQILISLEKESVLRQQLHIVVNKLLGKTIQQTAAAKTEDAAASAAAAAGDTALAAGETAATAAAGGLTVALKAVGNAIKSIPVIGWILAAVAALGTLTALVIKHNKAEKENNQTLQQRKALMREINEVEKESLESVQKNVVAMEANVRRLKEADVGTREWSNLVKEVAGDLGVTEEWLQKNVDKVDELKDAWVNMQIAMAKGEAYAKKIADNEIKIATAEAEIARIMADEKYKDRAEAISKELGVSIKAAKALVEADHKLKKNDTSSNFVTYANAKNAIVEEIQTQNKALMYGLDEAYKQQVEASEELTKIAGDGIKETGNKVKKEAVSVKKDVKKTAKELSEELEDIMVEGMADGLEKQIAEVVKASDRFVAKMKDAKEKDAENAEYYNKLILEKEKQTQDKIKKMRADGYKEVLANAKKLADSYTSLWYSTDGNGLFSFITQLKKVGAEINSKVEEYNKSIAKTLYRISDADKAVVDDLVKQFKDTVDTKEFVKDFGGQLAESLKDGMNIFSASSGESGLYIPEAVAKAYPLLEELEAKIQEVFNKAKVSYSDFVKDINKNRDQLVKDAGVAIIEKYVDQFISAIEEIPDIISTNIGGKSVSVKYTNNPGEAFIGALKEMQETMDFNRLFKEADLVPEYINRTIDGAYTNAKYLADILSQIYGDSDENVKRLRDGIIAFEDDLATSARMAENSMIEPISDITEAFLMDKEKNKALEEYARNVREVFLNEAKKGMMDSVPENFTVYIDFEMSGLDKKIVELRTQLEKMAIANPNDTDAFVQITEQIVKLQEEKDDLQKLLTDIYRTEAEVNGYTRKDIETGNFNSFFDNQELLNNLMNIKEIENQIQAVTLAMERGKKEQEAINTLEGYNQSTIANRIELERQLAQATDDETKATLQSRIDAENMWLEMNQASIDQHRVTMAALGYTTEEEMRQLLDNLVKQEQAFADQTGVIMKKTANSVVQSIGNIANSLLDLMNAIGEDNAEMANFLEGVAYMQIGVNMAVGVSEAISAGAGVPFPANLAAIASGVAAVVSGIASAISTYKQYHKNISSPRFAEGGYVSGEKGVDKIPAWLSDGEYVIKRKRVKELGVPFLDALNEGKSVVGRTHFAEGGYVNSNITNIVMNEEMRSMMIDAMNEIQPIVSVAEISKVQNRVRVKESIARK